MADKKISALTGATTPLAGTEVLPVVQGGATVKVAVSDLTAGRAVSATQLTSTVAIGTAPLVVTSTTNVANLNASSLNGATFAAPGPIGDTTPAAGSFTTLSATRNANTPNYVAITNTNAGTAAITGLSVTTDQGSSYLIQTSSAVGGIYAGSLIIQNNFGAAATIKHQIQSNVITTTSAAGLAVTGALSASGDATVTGNLIIGTSGNGIDFSATSHPAGMTSELLADYEEGTFTAGIAFGGASVGITYDTTPTCTYTKIGRQVTVTGRVGLTSKGSSTGDATITGLPFTSANTGNAGYGAVTLAFGSGTTFSNVFEALITPNSTSIILLQVTVLGTQSSLTDTNFSNSSNLLFTGTYFI
jgi:hypothetical protein